MPKAFQIAFSLIAAAAGISAPQAFAGYSDAELRSAETQDESRIREIRNQEITQLRIALGRRSPSNRMAELYLRLAEIYLEAYRTDYLLEGRVHDKKLEAGQPDKFIDHTHSRPHLSAGINACKEILKFNIRMQKLDQVYYFLGFNYGELEDRNQSLKYFSTLIQNFPNSAYAVDAYREMGDAAFGQGQYRKAVGYYESALQRNPGESTARIQHKLAWCNYRMKQFDRAVEVMKQAITATQKSGERFVSLREEALRDMAIFMTETGKVEEAVNYFQAVAGDKTFFPKVLEKLGRQYERNVEPLKAIQVYEALLKSHPDSDAGFRVLVKLVDLDLRRGRYKEALGRIQNLQPLKSADGDTQVAAQNLRAMIRRTATESHEKFRKSADRGLLEISEAYYAGYLKIFLSRDDPRVETPEIQMYLAEVKRELGKSREASELYRKVVDSRDKRYAKEAGALWTASLAEAIKKDPSAKSGKADEPSEIEKEFISASDSLQDALGDTPEGREAALKAAEVYAGYKGTQKDSFKRIRKLIARSPRSIQATTAARLWLQLIAERLPSMGSANSEKMAEDSGAADELRDTLKELRENSALMVADAELGKSRLRAMMAEQDTRLKIVAIARFERDRDYAAAAKGYEAFAKESNQQDLVERAYSNAMGSYLKAGDLESLDRVSGAWIKRFPKSAKASDALRGSATQLLLSGKFESSAKVFERLGLEGDVSSLETAARIFEGLGDASRAEQIWTVYLDRFKTSPGRAGVLLSMARTREAAQRDAEAAKSYRDCMSAGGDLEAECGARLADLHLRSKNVAEAKSLYKKVGALAGKSKGGLTSPFVGYARYRSALMVEEEAKFSPFQFPEARLKAAMNQRLEYVESLSRVYNAAVEAGGPWAGAALDKLAQWVFNLAEEIDQIAPPAGADPVAVANFKKSLATVSGPLRKKAIQTWTEGYFKSVQTESLSPVLPALNDRLAELKVSGVGRAQGVRGRLRLAGLASDGGADGAKAAMEKVRDRLQKNAQDSVAWVDYGNLLWGGGKPLLAKLAYDRALSLNSKTVSALNNRAVLELQTQNSALEDWFVATEASGAFSEALRQDAFFIPAKFNRALLLNYYHLFSKAKPLWDQILVKSASPEAQDGMAIALQGSGSPIEAEAAFKKAQELGASKSSFASIYHEAARIRLAGSEDAARCLSRLDDLDSKALGGFEKEAFERMKRTCTQWKSEK